MNSAQLWEVTYLPLPAVETEIQSDCKRFDLLIIAAKPVTESEFKMFQQAMKEQGQTHSSTADVCNLLFSSTSSDFVVCLIISSAGDEGR